MYLSIASSQIHWLRRKYPHQNAPTWLLVCGQIQLTRQRCNALPLWFHFFVCLLLFSFFQVIGRHRPSGFLFMFSTMRPSFWSISPVALIVVNAYWFLLISRKAIHVNGFPCHWICRSTNCDKTKVKPKLQFVYINTYMNLRIFPSREGFFWWRCRFVIYQFRLM